MKLHHGSDTITHIGTVRNEYFFCSNDPSDASTLYTCDMHMHSNDGNSCNSFSKMATGATGDASGPSTTR